MQEANVPIRIAICCNLGVEPTRKPVFRSCEIVPPFDDAMQTMPPIERAVTKYGGAVQPIMRKMKHVSNSVAIIIPEVGQDDEPTSPVSRDETVTKRKPKATMSSAPNKLNRKFNCGAIMMTMSKAMIPPMTHFIERSRSVRGTSARATPEPRRSASPPFNPCQMRGIERKRLMMPAAATAPAPM